MDGFRHVVPIEVRFHDLDALGHVNNTVYLVYAETGRLSYLAELGFTLPITHWSDFTLIVVHTSCDFKKPILYGQKVAVGTHVTAINRSSMRLDYRIESEGKLAAEGYAIVVYYDHASNCAKPIPQEMRTKIEAFENDKLSN